MTWAATKWKWNFGWKLSSALFIAVKYQSSQLRDKRKVPRCPYIVAHCPTVGAIDGKKSSGSAEIAVPGLCGPAVRLSIYNVIGYRLGRRRLLDGDEGGTDVSAVAWQHDRLEPSSLPDCVVCVTANSPSSSSSTSSSSAAAAAAARLWSGRMTVNTLRCLQAVKIWDAEL